MLDLIFEYSLRNIGKKGGQASRLISTGKLNALLRLHRRPIEVVVFNLPLVHYWKGYLIFGGAWRLDAFSAYPFPT